MRDKYPIAYCPVCHRTALYSDDPGEKKNMTAGVAEPDYHGTMMLCGKCKTMLAVIEKPKVAKGFVALPIINAAV